MRYNPNIHKNMKDYTYALMCPISRKVRYVGATGMIENRFKQHLVAARSYSNKNTLLCDWINQLGMYGYKPIFLILCQGNSEWYKIREYAELNVIYNKSHSSHLDCIEPMPLYSDLFKNHYNHFIKK